MRGHQAGVPHEVLGFHGDSIDGKLYAGVADGTHVGEQGLVVVRRYGNVVVIEKVGGQAVVVVYRSAYASVLYGEVQTDVELALTLPCEVGVGVGCRGIGLDPSAVVEEVGAGTHQHQGLVVAEVLVAGHTVAGAEFELAEPVDVLHPGFLADAPAGADGGEPSPLVILAEAAGAVAAERYRCEVFLVPVVDHAAEEGDVSAG